MVLPDDKKKTIYWDYKLKRYVNKDQVDDPVAVLKPPPTFLPAPKSEQIKQASNTPHNFNTSNLDQPQQQSNGGLSIGQTQMAGQADPSIQQLNSAPNRFSLKNTGKRTNYYSNIDVMADK